LIHLAATAGGELAFYRHEQPSILRTGPADRHPPAGADVNVPAWLASSFAILMVAIAVYCAARLAISRLRGRNTERAADALHVLMGVAMAGMLEPRLTPVPVTAWRAVFAAAGVWFAWQATRPGRRGRMARCAHPAAHAVECAAMVYMLLPIGSWPSGHGPAMAMPGMSQGTTIGNPALTLVLALFMLGYVLWAIDQLARLSRTPAPATARVATPRRSPLAAYPHPAGSTVLAPRLAASSTIAMAITMGYMLITML
jgi:Domain of unknown function (DUF5134)